MVHAMEHASGCKVPYQIIARRAGDIATCFADPSFAEQEIGWKAERGLIDMANDTWHWQSKNPQGYK